MGRTAQSSRGKAERAQRDARIYQLAVAGRTEREIAAVIGLSPARVHAIVAEEIGRRVGPPAEEYAARRDVELAELWRRVFATLVTTEDADGRLRAVDRLVKINESRRKLRGADAGETLTVSLERRTDQETDAVVTAVLAALRAVGLDGERRQYALEAAATVLRGEPEPEALPPAAPAPAACVPYREDGQLYIDGPDGLRYRVAGVERQPSPVVSQLALPPGPSARAQPRNGADAVLAAVRAFEDEFGSLDDGEEDGTAGTGSNRPESDGTEGTGTEGA
ncbi:hypothetical protein [Streptomyces sp. NPDC001221]